jgi:hypothetical protein
MCVASEPGLTRPAVRNGARADTNRSQPNEVLDLAAFVLVFAGAVYSLVRRPTFEVTHS